MPTSPFYKNALTITIVGLILIGGILGLIFLGSYPLIIIYIYGLTLPISFLLYKNREDLSQDLKSFKVNELIGGLLAFCFLTIIVFSNGRGKYVTQIDKVFLSGHIKKGEVFIDADVVQVNDRNEYVPEHYEDTYRFIPTSSSDKTFQGIIENASLILFILIPIVNYMLWNKASKYELET